MSWSFTTGGSYPGHFTVEYVGPSGSAGGHSYKVTATGKPEGSQYPGCAVIYHCGSSAAGLNYNNGSIIFFGTLPAFQEVGGDPQGNCPTDTHISFVDYNSNPLSSPVYLTIAMGATGPNTLTADGGLNKIDLSWSAIEGAVRYELYREGELIYSGPDLTYSDAPLGFSVSHSYEVLAYGYAGEGDAGADGLLDTSNTATATTDPLPPVVASPVSGASGPMPIQKHQFLVTLQGAVTHARGVNASNNLVGAAVPCALAVRGLALANTAFLTLDPTSTRVAFLAGSTVLYVIPLTRPPVADSVALTFGGG